MARTPTRQTKAKRAPAPKPIPDRPKTRKVASPKRASAIAAAVPKGRRPAASTPASKMNKAELEAHVVKLEKTLDRAKKTIAVLRADLKAQAVAQPVRKTRTPRAAKVEAPAPSTKAAPTKRRGPKPRQALATSTGDASESTAANALPSDD